MEGSEPTHLRPTTLPLPSNNSSSRVSFKHSQGRQEKQFEHKGAGVGKMAQDARCKALGSIPSTCTQASLVCACNPAMGRQRQEDQTAALNWGALGSVRDLVSKSNMDSD